jgi:spermidine/putrescine transport system substrate-binding protein
MTRREPRRISSEAAAVIRAQAVSRRSLLGGAGALGLGAFLGACGTGQSGAPSRPTPAADRSESERIVSWANWTAYLDYDEKKKVFPTLEKFEKRTQIQTVYTEDIEDNDSYFGKISGQLKNGQDIGKDVLVFTDYMVDRCIRQGYAQRLDKSVIPNSRNLLDSLVNVDFDPGRNYSLTWQSGYGGLVWNKKKIEDMGISIRNVSDLWNPELKGRVSVLVAMRETIGMIMREQGVDITGDFGSAEYDRALEVLHDQLNNGQIRKVTGNSYLQDLESGDVLACMGWSGDVLAANFEAGFEKYHFFLPEAGGTMWSDNLMVPIGSPHKRNAEILMNYYYDPVVAAEVAAYINYICPVEGAREEMLKIDPDLAESQYIFPTEEDLRNVQIFRSLSVAEETEFNEKFSTVLGV